MLPFIAVLGIIPDMAQIIPTAEPFLFPGSDVGCLLIHGFTGTPKEMRWMGEYLHKQGFTVLGVRLAGHATRPEDMIPTNYTHWLASVEDGYRLLSGLVGRIYIMGLSMGGVLALTTAATLPVKGVVAMSTPYKLLDNPVFLKYATPVSKFVPFAPKGKEHPGSNWFDHAAWSEHVSYPQNPVRSGGQMNRLLGEMHAALPQINIPVLLIHSRNDRTVWSGSMPAIYQDLGSQDKEMLWIEKSGHVVTRDAEREIVFRAAADFVHRVEAAT